MATPVSKVLQFTCVVTAGTDDTAPIVFQCQLGSSVLEWVEIQVPRGPNGQMGFYVASSGQQVIPYIVGAATEWIVSSDRILHLDLVDFPDSGDYQLVAYNTGTSDHTIQIAFGINQVDAPDTGQVSAQTASAQLSTLT